MQHMTLTEFLQMPKGLTMPQYEKLLQEKKRLEKQVKKLSLSIYDEVDALDILKDEAGSERHKKHLASLQDYTKKRDKAQNKLAKVLQRLK